MATDAQIISFLNEGLIPENKWLLQEKKFLQLCSLLANHKSMIAIDLNDIRTILQTKVLDYQVVLKYGKGKVMVNPKYKELGRNMILNIVSNGDLGFDTVVEIQNAIKNSFTHDINIIFGSIVKEDIEGYYISYIISE